MERIYVYLIVIAFVASLPRLIEVVVAYITQYLTRKRLIDRASQDNLTHLELKELVKDPGGIPGTARTTIALTVIVILGVAIFHLLVYRDGDDDGQIISNILSMLAGLLAAITGFYFGGRASTEGGKAKEEKEKATGAGQEEGQEPVKEKTGGKSPK